MQVSKHPRPVTSLLLQSLPAPFARRSARSYAVYGYVPGQPGSLLPLALSYMTWIALACLTAYLAYLIIDDDNADMLLAVGSVILLSGIFSEFVNTGLKIVGCRPRYKYLLNP